MNAKMGWLVKPSGLVEPKGLLDGQVEGADQMALKTAVIATTGSMAAASSPTTPSMAILMTMKITPETKVVTKVATMAMAGLTGRSYRRR